jgi:methionyl-tRNA synthetase
MLKLHGNIVPANVPANEFMNLEGDKMSTSRNWKLEMQDYIDDFINKDNGGSQMADVLRYYLTTILPETKDSEFTWKGFQDANNSELVSVFGNFVNRAFVMMHKLCKGKVPPYHKDIEDGGDRQLIADIKAAKEKVESLIEQFKFREALFEVVDLARKGNGYLQKREPWKKLKVENDIVIPQVEDAKRLVDNTLHLCLQLTANLAILINPFLPFTARKMLHMMKVVEKMLEWENAGKINLLKTGYSLRAPELLFRKIENDEITYQVEKLKKGLVKQDTSVVAPSHLLESAPAEVVPETPAFAPVKPEIVYEYFSKLDLRVGKIVSAEKVAKADKLLKLQIDLGFETRTIVSGIAQHFNPEEIVGRQVVVVVNLAPRKMRGIESNGMILMAEDAGGKLHFINPEEVINAGAGVS